MQKTIHFNGKDFPVNIEKDADLLKTAEITELENLLCFVGSMFLDKIKKFSEIKKAVENFGVEIPVEKKDGVLFSKKMCDLGKIIITSPEILPIFMGNSKPMDNLIARY